MRCLLLWMIIVLTANICIGQPGPQIYFTISVPDSWEITGVGCNGITAVDSMNPARGIIALNHLHQGFDILPSYTTPETYVEYYMPQDFSVGGDQITNMTIIAYEDNQDIANAYVSWTGVLGSAKSMRCSFEVNSIPAEGSFTVATRELFGYGTTVDLLFGIFAPAGQFDMDAPMLLGAIDSIRMIRDYFCICFECPAYGCDYHCTNGCCDHPCDEYDRCKEVE
jgi:hypothetical protein